MTMSKLGLALVGLILAGVILLPETKAFSRAAPNRGQTERAPSSDITWEKALQKDGLTVTPGSARADFGRFNFYCQVTEAGQGSLVTITSRGGGELPPRTEKLLILVDDDGTTLMQQWFPLANSRQPARLKAIVTVPSKQLFAVLPRPELPEAGGQIKTVSSISWSKIQTKDRAVRLPGKIRAKSGLVAVFWKTEAGQSPELFLSRQPDNDRQSVRDEKLYLWEDAAAQTTTLYREERPLAGKRGSAYLWPVAVVRTGQLMAKLAKL